MIEGNSPDLWGDFIPGCDELTSLCVSMSVWSVLRECQVIPVLVHVRVGEKGPGIPNAENRFCYIN